MEISNYMDFQFLIRFLEGLQKFLGDNCEIIVHDYRKGYDHTIVYAFNSQLSGRDVGGSPRGGMITQLGNDIEPLKHSIISLDTSQKDRLFKSCTTLIENEHHKIIGSVCLNMDVRDLYLAQSALQNLIGRPGTIGVSAAVGAQIDGMSGCTPSGMASDGTFSGTGSTDGTNGANQAAMSDRDFILKKNVDDILQHYIYQAESMIGKPMMLMNKEEKIRALDYLDQKRRLQDHKKPACSCATRCRFPSIHCIIIWKKRGFHERVKRMNKNHKLILSTSVCLTFDSF